MFIELSGDFSPDELARELGHLIQCLKETGIEFVVKPRLQFSAYSKGEQTFCPNGSGEHPGLIIARMRTVDGIRSKQTRYGFWFIASDTQLHQYDCLTRVEKVWDASVKAFGTEQEANDFMKTPIEGTGIPRDLAAHSEFGANIALSNLRAIAPSKPKRNSVVAMLKGGDSGNAKGRNEKSKKKGDDLQGSN